MLEGVLNVKNPKADLITIRGALANPIAIKVTLEDRSSLFAGGVYCLKYRKRAKVKAYKDSLGCMCFNSQRAAVAFAEDTFGSFRASKDLL